MFILSFDETGTRAQRCFEGAENALRPPGPCRSPGESTSIRGWCSHGAEAPAYGNPVRTCCLVTTVRLRHAEKRQKSTHGGVCLLTTRVLLCGRTCQALFLIFPAACTESPCGRPNGIVSLARCWWLRDSWSSLAPNDLLSVVTALGHAPDPACALGAGEARGGQPLLIIGARCEPVPPNELSTPAQNPFPLLRTFVLAGMG
jgi:hypothetical protein